MDDISEFSDHCLILFYMSVLTKAHPDEQTPVDKVCWESSKSPIFLEVLIRKIAC